MGGGAAGLRRAMALGATVLDLSVQHAHQRNSDLVSRSGRNSLIAELVKGAMMITFTFLASHCIKTSQEHAYCFLDAYGTKAGVSE